MAIIVRTNIGERLIPTIEDVASRYEPKIEANIDDLATHKNNNTIHVTSTEKSIWNNKQNALGFTPENSANRNVAGGYVGLNADGKISSSQLPAIAFTDTFPVQSEGDMLALTQAEIGDVAVRYDISKSFILKQSPPSILSNWQELLTPVPDVSNLVKLNSTTTQTIEAPQDISATEVATTWFNTSNGGRVGFGKEKANSGTAIFFEQVKGIRRLDFRSSSTLGAMVWAQPESNSRLYFDVSNITFRNCGGYDLSLNGFIPTSAIDPRDLGSSSHKWNDLYLKNDIYIDNNLYLKNKIVTGATNNITLKLPTKDGTLALLSDIVASATSLPLTQTNIGTATLNILTSDSTSTDDIRYKTLTNGANVTIEGQPSAIVISVPSVSFNAPSANGEASNLKVLTSDSTSTDDIKYKTITAGSNVTITGTQDEIRIASTNTTYSVASDSLNGLMSKEDKIKLNGIATGATANIASSTLPKVASTANAGSETNYSRGDHIHPKATYTASEIGAVSLTASEEVQGSKIFIETVEAPSFKMGSSKIIYSATTDSIDFIFN